MPRLHVLHGLLCLLGLIHAPVRPLPAAPPPTIELDDDEGYPAEEVYRQRDAD